MYLNILKTNWSALYIKSIGRKLIYPNGAEKLTKTNMELTKKLIEIESNRKKCKTDMNCRA